MSAEEWLAIRALRALARRWPATLTLISVDGGLHVIRTGDPRYGHEHGSVRAEAVIETIEGIPNDGGGW